MAFQTNPLNFPNLTVKGTPVGADLLMIADSASANIPSQCTVASLPFVATASLPLSLANGGTNHALSASNGGVLYSDATKIDILPGTATALQMLQSGASGAPAWSTATWPATTVSNQLLWTNFTNTVQGLATANNAVLVTNSSGTPGWSTGLPSIVQGNITTVGAVTATSLSFSTGTNGIIGNTTAANASAGVVGEFISSVVLVGSAVSLTTATTANVTSISLTAGDWDVWGNVGSLPAATTTTSSVIGAISQTTATLPDASLWAHLQAAFPANASQKIVVPSQRINISGTTTIFLVMQTTFAISTMTGFGGIYARRRR